MKIKRFKKVNKNLNFYINNFGFRQPYQLLVDGTFCYAALNNKINIADNIPRYLHGEIKLLTTQCAVIEMESLGSKLLNGALMILKKYGIHKCGHEGKPIRGAKCIRSMLGQHNENHYIILTQDRDLQERVRKIPGVPLLYLHIKTPTLEQPSPASIEYAKTKLSGMGDHERQRIEQMKVEKGLVPEAEVKRKKKKKKGANPLSCKKKKKTVVADNVIRKKEGQPDIEKKKRKKIRIPKHVRDELLKQVV